MSSGRSTEYAVRLTTEAIEHLEAIYNFIQAGYSDAALDWYIRLEMEIQSLRNFPSRGSLYGKSSSERQILFGTKPHVYRLRYRIDQERKTVFVMQILHGARLG